MVSKLEGRGPIDPPPLPLCLRVTLLGLCACLLGLILSLLLQLSYNELQTDLLNVKLHKKDGHRFCKSLDCKLGGAVDCTARDSINPSCTGDVDDTAAVIGLHIG